MIENDKLTEKIIGCCFEVHGELGPGFNEKVYQRALKEVLEKNGIEFEEERIFNVNFRGKKVGSLKTDLLVENKVIVELKAVMGIMPKVFEQQVIAYLKATGLKVALLVNFGNKSCKVRRIMNSLITVIKGNHRNHDER